MKRILVIKLSALGDIVHCLPAITQLQNAFPESQIDWLVEKQNRILIDRSGLKVGLLPMDTRSARKKIRSIPPMIQMIREIRNTRYDCAIDFQGLIKSALLTYLSGAPRRIGFSSAALREPMAGLFYTDRITPQRVHIVDQLQELLTPLGIQTAKRNSTLSVSETAHQAVREKLPCSEYLVIHPGGGWPTKRWPLSRFYELARRLARKIPVVITFAPNEETLESLSREGIYEIRTTLDEQIALSAGARLFISGDTGPLHIAAVLKTPIVALFGPTSSERNGPINPHDIVVEHPLSCRPCYKRDACPLGHWNCMDELSVDEVYQACLKRLDGLA